MNDIKKILIAKNEIENLIENVQTSLKLNEMEMAIALEMVLSTARYKTLVRGIYDEVKKGEDNGDQSETR